MVCDEPQAPTIRTGVNTPASLSMGAYVRLVYHCTSNRARGSHPYWPHNTQKVYHGWMYENWGTSSSALDGVWWTKISNNLYAYMCWYPSQLINGCMGGVDTPLHMQPNKGITSILAIQYPNDEQWVDGWELGHFHPLHWMVRDEPWDPIIHTYVCTNVNSSVGAWEFAMF